MASKRYLDLFKESGASSQPQASLVVERLGSSVSEPSFTTRDALDKYQVVAQKVVIYFNSNSNSYCISLTIKFNQTVSIYHLSD